MFSRSPAAEPKPIGGGNSPLDVFRSIQSGAVPPPAANGAAPVAQPQSVVPPPQQPRPSTLGAVAVGSLIGNDLTIVGQGLRIMSKGTLQVDGKVDGDVVGKEVVVGNSGVVTGVVQGESVIVRGQVHGTIKAVRVTLQSTSQVEGDIHQMELTMEHGAQLEGRVRRAKDSAELLPEGIAAS